jgi:long-subunit acyl-CoA synthetase (AMP-forming)
VTGSVLSKVIAGPPPGDHQVSFRRLDGSTVMSLAELHGRARRLAAALRCEGVRPGDRIGILAANSPEWVLLDLAALMLKAVTAGFEPGKFEPGPELTARYALTLLFTDRPASGPGIRPLSDVGALIERAGPADAAALPPAEFGPAEPTTIKFTSGSTGEPKGLAATAGSIGSSISAVQEMFGHGPGDNLFLFLPLSLVQQRYWVYSALAYGHDLTIATYEAAFPALRAAGPTVVMGVPAFYETARRHIEAQAARGAPSGSAPELGAAPEALRDAAAGLFGDRIRYLWTGSAPARQDTLRFFTAAGLPIYEGYGLNEACIVAKNHPGAHREGSVGQVLRGKQVLVDSAGVISIRSDFPVNTRYEYAAPGASERVFQPGGIVRTGDVGYLDADGFLFIKGRADDVIVLDNGKKIIVAPLEEYFRASPAIEECVVFCPAQTRLVAVVSPSGDPADEAAIAAWLAAANAEFGADEQIADVVIARPRFTIANGMLTSQFKPRRAQIAAAYLPAAAPAGRVR